MSPSFVASIINCRDQDFNHTQPIDHVKKRAFFRSEAASPPSPGVESVKGPATEVHYMAAEVIGLSAPRRCRPCKDPAGDHLVGAKWLGAVKKGKNPKGYAAGKV
jgi:hypothetical protein